MPVAVVVLTVAAYLRGPGVGAAILVIAILAAGGRRAGRGAAAGPGAEPVQVPVLAPAARAILVHGAIAVVVQAVPASLSGPGVNGGVAVVAVGQLAVRAHAPAVPVAVGAHDPGAAVVNCAVAVVVLAVAAHLGGPRVDIGVFIVAVTLASARLASNGVAVSVAIHRLAATVIGGAVAVVVQAVAAHLRGPRVHGEVSVRAVLGPGATVAAPVAVPVLIHALPGGAAIVNDLVAVVVDVVPAHLHAQGVDGLVIVVAILKHAAGPLAEPVTVLVHAGAARASVIRGEIAVLVHAVSAHLGGTGVDGAVLIVAVLPPHAARAAAVPVLVLVLAARRERPLPSPHHGGHA